MPTNKRPVVRSDGKEYPSISAAARDIFRTVGPVHLACKATKYGVYQTVGGFQWACIDEVPKVWPPPISRWKPVVNSNGEKFSSVSEAARNMSAPGAATGSISAAAKGTQRGLYRTAGRLQWAYADQVPEVWPVKEPVKPPIVDLLKPVYPPTFTERKWRSIPGLRDYEVSSGHSVRQVNAESLLPRVDRQGASLVRIHDRFYSIVDLTMLAFVGPKPFGYTVRKLKGEFGEVLSN